MPFVGSGNGGQMSRAVAGARVFFCAASVLLVALFVHIYSGLQANMIRCVYKLGTENLPLPTVLYFRHPWLGYLLVAAALATPLIRGGTEEGGAARREVYMCSLYFLGLLWLFGCVIACQLPLYIPVAFIK